MKTIFDNYNRSCTNYDASVGRKGDVKDGYREKSCFNCRPDAFDNYREKIEAAEPLLRAANDSTSILKKNSFLSQPLKCQPNYIP